jgi:hypothetical protein
MMMRGRANEQGENDYEDWIYRSGHHGPADGDEPEERRP